MNRPASLIALAAGWLGIAFASTVGAMILAVGAPGSPAVNVEARLPDPGRAGHPQGTSSFAPVSAEILDDLGRAGLALGLSLSGPGSLTDGRHDADSRRPTAHPDDLRPMGSGRLATPEELADEPDVRIEMSVDRAQAQPAATLRYVIRAANVGRGAAKELQITSHIPEHTTLVAGADCEGESVGVQPNPGAPGGHTIGVCLPGPGAPGEHGIQIGFGPLGPGRVETFVFRVAIDPDTPSGSVIRNHAHVDGADIPRRTSNEVSTVVV